jgi:phosphatidylserine synthase
MWLLAAAFPLCAAWRLARYNDARENDDREEGSFLGLPTTGAGAAAATAVLLYLRTWAAPLPFGPAALAFLVGGLSLLMVSNFPYQHAGAIISKLRPATGFLAAVALVLGSLVWHYEYVFAAVVWGYVASGPLQAATEKIRAVRHA